MNGVLDREISESYSPRLSVRFKKAYQDAKLGIVEDIILYSFGLFYSILADHCYNALYLLGLNDSTHPIDFGISQVIGGVIFTVLLARKISQWKYYQ